jgi:TRAP-type uncharacterized transport system substrate-binding protein
MPLHLAHILRWCGPAVAGFALCAAPLSTASAERSAEHAKGAVIEIITDGDGASLALAQDLASVIDDGATRRLLPVVGHGGMRDVIDLSALRGVDLAIVSKDALDLAKKPSSQASLENVTYVARLYNEELHILARPHIHSIEDLAGRRVNFDGSAVVTGPEVLSLLKIEVEAGFDSPAVAQAKLRSGDIAAIVYLAPKPTPRFAVLNDANGLHFLPIPMKPELAKSYAPASLSARDYPRLVHDEAPVETIAVAMVMVAGNLPRNSDRYRNVANFVDAFFTQLPQLQADHRTKWGEVTPAAELPGWTRFPPAEAWLKRHVVAPAPVATEDELHATFAKFLDERSRQSGGRELSAQEKEQLFDQFRRWKSAQTTQ